MMDLYELSHQHREGLESYVDYETGEIDIEAQEKTAICSAK